MLAEARPAAHLDEVHNLVMLQLADDRALAAIFDHGVTHFDGLCPLLQLLVEGGGDAFLHQQA